MATKKKAKAATASKAKKPAAKKTVKAKAVKKAASKKAAGPVKKKAAKQAAKKATAIPVKNKTKVKAKAKTSTKTTAKKEREIKPKTPVITHGEDLHLIPVQGEIHPARRDEAQLLEKQFRHNQQIAWQREKQHARQIAARTNTRVFKNPRQS